MGLLTMPAKPISVSLPDGMVDEIDRVRGELSRSEYIRAALEGALANTASGGVRKVDYWKPGPSPVAQRHAKARADVSKDEGVILGLLDGRVGMTERQIVGELGWAPMRVSRVCGRLSAAKQIVYRMAGVMSLPDVHGDEGVPE